MANITDLELPEGVQWLSPVVDEPPLQMLIITMLFVAIFMACLMAWLFGPPLPRRSGLLHDVRGRVLLVIAHPDDEAMFFWPTLLQLHNADVPLSILCLSTGNADGLGEVRIKEMQKSCARLGISSKDLVIIDANDFQDGFHAWPEEAIANQVIEIIRKQHATLVLTFDDMGVSGHPNHISTSRGVQLAQKMSCSDSSGDTGRQLDFKVLLLETVGLPKKYFGPLNLVLFNAAANDSSCSQDIPACTCINPTACLRAMFTHWSQLVWYRGLFAVFSRYAYVNTYVVNIPTSFGATSNIGIISDESFFAGTSYDKLSTTHQRRKTETSVNDLCKEAD